MVLSLHSSAFPAGARIPAAFTCDGQDLSPPLTWSTPPANTRAQLVSMVDLDAPRPPFVHWALAGLAPTVHGLGPGDMAPGTTAGANGFGGIGYRGPCPPRGDHPHRYRIEVDALDQAVPLPRGFDLRSAGSVIFSHTVAQGRLVALYR